MKIDTDILRNELMKPIEVGETTEDYDRGWHECTIAVEDAIKRAEKGTIQQNPMPGSDAVEEFWNDTEIFNHDVSITGEQVKEVSITGEPVDIDMYHTIMDAIEMAIKEERLICIDTSGGWLNVRIHGDK